MSAEQGKFTIPQPVAEVTPPSTAKEETLVPKTEVGFNKLYGSLALAAALIGGFPDAAEAGGSKELKINAPEAARLTVELQSLGVNKLEFVQSMSLGISTDKGVIYLPKNNDKSPDAQVNEALKGVSGAQFLNEIQRQKSQERQISEQIKTSHGVFSVSVTPYAREVMKQIGVTYENGILSNGRHRVNLSGEGAENPNSECTISGTGTLFKNMIEAACREIKVVNGKPLIESVTYRIGADLIPEQVTR